MKFINIKKCLVVASSGIILSSMSGCVKNKTNSNKETITTFTTSVSEVMDTKVPETKDDASKTTAPTKKIVTEEKDIDEVVINYFKELKDNVKKYVNKTNFDVVKDKTMDSLVTLTDFIFYDKEIKGVTFDQLKDETKTIIIDSFLEVDQLIMTKFPNYKEAFLEKTGSAYNLLIEKLDNLKTKSKEKIISKLGDEKYNQYLEKYNRVKDEYNEVMDDTKEDVKKIKQRIKNWYENKTGK